MTFEWDVWGLPVVVMAVAGVAGMWVASTLRRDDRQAEAIGESGRIEDLNRRHADALEALASLETQQAQMAPEDYQAERKALLEKGATAMRKLDEATGTGGAAAPTGDAISAGVAELTAALKRGELDEVTYARAVAALASSRQAAPPAAAPAGSPAPSRPAPAAAQPSVVAPAWQGAIYALVGAALIGGLLWYAANQAQPRREGASMTGNQDLGVVNSVGEPIQRPPESAFVQERRAQAEARIAADPNDLQALNELTQISFVDPAKAWNYNEMARKVDPKDPDARVYHAVITAMMGMPEKAEERFEELLAELPEHGPGWAWRGLVQLEMDQFEKAEASLLRAKELGITDHTLDNSLKIAQNKGQMPGGGPGPVPPHPGASAPPHPTGQAPAAASATIASGTVDIDPGRVNYNGKTLFVSVKDAAAPGMPPLAAVQLPPGPFPMPFAITDAHKMAMGGDRPMPAQIVLTLRLDDDGNAFTKGPSDPQVEQTLPRGSTGLSLTLK